jgi:hypothetical protein
MSNHNELRDLRSEGIYFTSKYKFMILKSTTTPQIKKATVGSQLKYKIYITISIWVLFWCLVRRHDIFKKLASLICAYFINFRFNVCVLATLIIGDKLLSVHPDISKIFFSFHEYKQLHTNRCYQISNLFGKQLNNFWTWNNSMLT